MLFRNPIYAVFCFICFILCIILLLLFLQTEFLAYLLLLIYVGAIAVLFLFSIILLNIKDIITANTQLTKELFFIYSLFLMICYIIHKSFILYNNSAYAVEANFLFSNPILWAFFHLDINSTSYFFIMYYFLLFICLLILLVGILGTALCMRTSSARPYIQAFPVRQTAVTIVASPCDGKEDIMVAIISLIKKLAELLKQIWAEIRYLGYNINELLSTIIGSCESSFYGWKYWYNELDLLNARLFIILFLLTIIILFLCISEYNLYKLGKYALPGWLIIFFLLNYSMVSLQRSLSLFIILIIPLLVLWGIAVYRRSASVKYGPDRELLILIFSRACSIFFSSMYILGYTAIFVSTAEVQTVLINHMHRPDLLATLPWFAFGNLFVFFIVLIFGSVEANFIFSSVTAWLFYEEFIKSGLLPLVLRTLLDIEFCLRINDFVVFCFIVFTVLFIVYIIERCQR